MNSLYELLNKTPELDERRKIIREYNESHEEEVNDVLTKTMFIGLVSMTGGKLTEEKEVPSWGNSMFSYAVGEKYREDELAGGGKSLLYIDGIVRDEKNNIGFLAAVSDLEGLSFLPRNWVEPPEYKYQFREEYY